MQKKIENFYSKLATPSKSSGRMFKEKNSNIRSLIKEIEIELFIQQLLGD